MRNSRYSTLLRLLLALVALAGLTYWTVDVRDKIQLTLHYDQHPREPFDFDDDTATITGVKPEAAAAGLVKGAVIETVNGEPYTGDAQIDEVALSAGPGGSVEFGFRRPDGSHATGTLTLVAASRPPGSATGMTSLLRQSLLFFVIPVVCMLLAYWVVFVKPSEPNAWLLLVLLSSPEVFFALGQGLSTGGMQLFRAIYYQGLQVLSPMALMLFGIYFPERLRLDARFPWAKWLLLGPNILACVIIFVLLGREYYWGGNPHWMVLAATGAERTINALNLIFVILYLVFVVAKLRSASSADAKRRLRVLLTGTGVGVASLLFFFVLLPHFGYKPNAQEHPWLVYTGATLFMIAPLTLAYVVLVQRAMDVSILIRQGTKYALARATLWIAQAAILLFIVLKLLPPIVEHGAGSTAVPELVAMAALLLGIRAVLQRRFQAWLDRKFFREAYDSERVLSELSDEVRKYTESGPLLQTVAKCVAETLHVTQIGMLLREGPRFCVAEAVGHFPGDPAQLALAANSSTIRGLTNTNAPAQLYREDPDAWYLMADSSERQTLDDLGTELLLPLPGRNRLMGVMALGPKQSEAAYSKSDMHLLQILATQTGMALEVSELAHSLAKEAAQRERVNREIEIAHEVQERLFPQEMPVLQGATVAGHCRPAQGVGGDYYDVFPLQDGRLGLAIGDVSGKGISAALLMASLRASLRGVTLDNPREFAKLMDKVNRLVYEASASNRYATFFFGALDPVTRVLECVNAGHNAPLVLRQKPDSESEILRLEADGPVVGLLPFAPYSEQSLQLLPGDLLITYTDGISEAMTHEDEEWGEDRMMAAAASARNGNAEDVLKFIFAEADRFTAGAPQHDDMTLLILKLEDLPQ
jgi:sigma-B regulation protein RsbU (phosphoserine phosphatase)